jgi:hypothetical protein
MIELGTRVCVKEISYLGIIGSLEIINLVGVGIFDTHAHLLNLENLLLVVDVDLLNQFVPLVLHPLNLMLN